MSAKAATKKKSDRLVGREGPEEPPHPDLAAKKDDNEQEKLPPAMKNGRAAVNFLRAHFEYDAKEDKRYVYLEISLELREEHGKFVPKEIKHWWEAMQEGGAKTIANIDVPYQYIELGLAPESHGTDLEIKGAWIEKAALAVVEEKGAGQAVDVIRFTFRAGTDLDSDVEKFACRHFGKTVWMKMRPVQGQLL
ncbi:MAG TPA: hypothetical protein VND65_01875 [Candidatus Binatia bacterium]|nr:hypothetical protein [Candidatus Binatia bacterium]